MIGVYENFPENIHRLDNLTSALANKRLQQKLIQTFHELNRKPFRFEEISHPIMNDCTVIFEMGIAEANSFSFIDEEETAKIATALKRETLKLMDFFCAIRYYKNYSTKRTPLKFDYYLLRFVFAAENDVELRIFHERGPRYITPEDLMVFVLNKVNGASGKRVLKKN
jgi:hypothetical protein